MNSGGAKVARSRSAKWRAVVLILVHVAIAAHVAHWWWSGRDDGVRGTLSPVEPSEAMATLNEGVINAGGILLGLAILSTLILGRWFCGWACHVVALQDLCLWLLKKVGVHPKPFRTRLMLWVPTGLALYMFVWPSVHRWVLTPGLEKLGWEMPLWLGRSTPWPGLSSHVMVEDFWATFPPWYVAVPFLLICGFVTVYFLGAKGFCTYGCPYGGFLAPADRLAVGRIVVNERCEGCGHCTAVCTSNVRVHEEVRDFGMVVDPGCMKCLDCVSVCPMEALSFSIARPAVLAKPRTAAAAERRSKPSPLYDLTLRQDAAMLAVFVAVLVCVRGMAESVPLLMAAGLASIIAWGIWKTWTLLTVSNVRAQNVQLKLKGRMTAAGWAFAVCAIALTGMSAWSGWVNSERWRSELLHAKLIDERRITVSKALVLSGEPTPTGEDLALAERIIAGLERSGGWAEGAWGWERSMPPNLELAWARAVVGDLEGAVEATRRALAQAERPGVGLIGDFVSLLRASGRSDDQILAELEAGASSHEFTEAWHASRAHVLSGLGRRDDAVRAATQAMADGPSTEPGVTLAVVQTLLGLGKSGEAMAIADDAVRVRPRSAEARTARGAARLAAGDVPGAVEDFEVWVRVSPHGEYPASAAVQRLLQAGRSKEALAIAEFSAGRRPHAADTHLARATARMPTQAGEPLDAARADELASFIEQYADAAWRDDAVGMRAAQMLLSIGRVDVLGRVLDRFVERRPHAQAPRYARAGFLLYTDRAGEAMEDLSRFVAASPSDSTSVLRAVQLMLQFGRLPEAGQFADRWETGLGGRWDAKFARALIALNAGDGAKAVELLREVISLDQRNVAAMRLLSQALGASGDEAGRAEWTRRADEVLGRRR